MTNTLIIIGAVLLGGSIVFVVGRRIVRKISHGVSQASKLISTIKAADDEQMYRPKTLMGTESIHLAKISKDFPEFNERLAKSYVKSVANAYFTTMSTGKFPEDIKPICSEQFSFSCEADAESSDVTYADVKIHKIVISDYRKSGDEAVIEFQMALQYVSNRTNRLSQEKYKADYSYFLEYGGEGDAASLICQNCGAAINSLGIKVCPYCEAAITAVSIERAWKVTDFKRCTYGG